MKTPANTITTVGRLSSLLCILWAITVLVGWVFDINALKRSIEISVAMNPLTAAGFILLGLAILCSSSKNHWINNAGYLVAVVVLVGSAIKLSDVLLRTSFGMDSYLFSTKLVAEAGFPSRMAPNTALTFFTLSISLLLMGARSNLVVIVSQLLTTLAVLFALVVLTGYLYDVVSFLGIRHYIPMAFNTACCFLLLSVAVLFIHANKGFMSVFVKDGKARSLALLLLPASFVMPFLFDWASLIGQRKGLYDLNTIDAISVVLNITTLLCLSYFIVRKVSLYDSLQEQEYAFRGQIIESLPGVFYLFDESSRFLSWNRNFENVTGYRSGEVNQLHPLDVIDGGDRSSVAAAIQQVFVSGQATVEANLLVKDGNRIPYLFTGTRVDFNGRPVVVGLGLDIAERRKSEIAIREAVEFATQARCISDQALEFAKGREQDYLSLVNNVPDYVMRYDRQHRHIIANDRAICDAGKTPEEYLGKTHREIGFPVHLCALFENAIEQCFTTRQPYTEVFEWESARGIRVLEWRTIPEFGADGSVRTVLGLSRDITEQRHADSALRLHSAILNSLSEGIMLIRAGDGIIVFTNKQFEHMFGYEPGGLLGKAVSILNAHDDVDPEAVAARIMAALLAKKSWFGEVKNIKKNGTPFWCQARVATFNHHEFGEVWVSIHTDISEKKQAEEVLVEREKLFKAISDTSPLAIYMSVGSDQQARYMNPMFTKLFGYTIEEVPSAEDWWPLAYPDISYRQRVMEEWQRRIQRAIVTRSAIEPMEVVVSCKDGSMRNILWHFVSIGSQNWAFGLDFTEAKQAQLHLQQLNEVLQQRTDEAQVANIAKSRFLATMSHEIRTPLNGILGMAQMLLMWNVSEQQRKDYAKTILDSGRTLLNLLNDILDISKIESGKITLELVPTKPRAVIDETHHLFLDSARLKSLAIESRWLGSADSYLLDPYRLNQMLSNLVGNAIKFTSVGGVRIEAREVERKDQTALLEFSVSDTGIGISQSTQEALFVPFSQVDSSITRQYGGSGLGLSIVRKLARMMGGDSGLESELGKGSRFWFRVQAVITEENAATAENIENIRQLQLSGTILIVDDNETNRVIVGEFIRKSGGIVLFSENGKQAIEVITSGGIIDVILMDLHMPIMDGYTATQLIRQWEAENGQLRHPIIAVTSDAFEEDRQRCFAAGMDDFIAKPFAMITIQDTIKKWLPRQESVVPCPPTKDVDKSLVIQYLRTLITFLEDRRFDAIECFGVLQETLVGTALAEEFLQIGYFIEQYNFAAALEALYAVMAANGLEE